MHPPLRHVHVFLDSANPDAACIAFQHGKLWQLCSWDLRRNAVVKGQWLTRAKLVLDECGMYQGLFMYSYREVGHHVGCVDHTVVSRVPYFTALLHYESSCMSGMRLLSSQPEARLRCVLRGPRELLKEYVAADVFDWTVLGPEWKGMDHEALRRGESMPPLDGPFLSTKSVYAGTLDGREVLLQHGKVYADGDLLVDWTDATFEAVPAASSHQGAGELSKG